LVFIITVNPGNTLSDLNRLANQLSSGVKTALEAGGKAGLSHAQSVVPVRTGFLRSTLYSEVKGDSLELGGRADYTAAVEFGTIRMPARPFIRPGGEVAVSEIQNTLPKGLGLQSG
jgi:HK97 gp10 family phage protein